MSSNWFRSYKSSASSNLDLLHTVTGKEYITQEQLKKEIASEISKLGRVSVIDLADTIGVDFISCAQDVVLSDPELMLVQGEIISQRYWDSIAEEINENAAKSLWLSLLVSYRLGSELLQSVLEPRLGTLNAVSVRASGQQDGDYGELKKMLELFQARAKDIVTVLKAEIGGTENQAVVQAIQDLEGTTGTTTETTNKPQAMQEALF